MRIVIIEFYFIYNQLIVCKKTYFGWTKIWEKTWLGRTIIWEKTWFERTLIYDKTVIGQISYMNNQNLDTLSTVLFCSNVIFYIVRRGIVLAILPHYGAPSYQIPNIFHIFFYISFLYLPHWHIQCTKCASCAVIWDAWPRLVFQ